MGCNRVFLTVGSCLLASVAVHAASARNLAASDFLPSPVSAPPTRSPVPEDCAGPVWDFYARARCLALGDSPESVSPDELRPGRNPAPVTLGGRLALLACALAALAARRRPPVSAGVSAANRPAPNFPSAYMRGSR